MNFRNFTPHPIVYRHEDGREELFPSCGIARVEEDKKFSVGGGYRFVHSTYGKLENIPPPSENTYFVVSLLCQQASDRGDLVTPADPLRDEAGRIIACQAWGR